MKSTRVAVSTFIETLSNMSALFSLNFFPGFRLYRRKDGKLQGVHLFATLLPLKNLAHIGTGINNVMHFFLEKPTARRVKSSCLAEEVRFCRGSRVEGRGRGKKNVFSCGLYLLGQDSLIFLVFT